MIAECVPEIILVGGPKGTAMPLMINLWSHGKSATWLPDLGELFKFLQVCEAEEVPGAVHVIYLAPQLTSEKNMANIHAACDHYVIVVVDEDALAGAGQFVLPDGDTAASFTHLEKQLMQAASGV
ncbi:MAG: hypothetical protein ACRD4B_05370 [Acidobacteriota bacterium]